MSEAEKQQVYAPETQADATAESSAKGNMPLLKVVGLKKYFPIQTNLFGKPTKVLRAVDDISFDVDTGKTIGVVGESGCGKTTLGRTVLKLYGIDGGKIYFEGDDITDLKKGQMQKYRTDIQLIFQDPYSSLPPRMTVGSIIAEPVRVHKIVPKEQVHSYVLDIMKKCGLKPQHYDRYPHEFSGGQRQRICIARALAVKPKLVICDEPVSALDVSIQAQIINLLKELQQTMGLAYVFISHDLSVVKYITDKILVMYLGNAMELSETEELFDNPLHPYTKALFSAVPAPNPNVKMNRIVLEGDIPSPANPPSGCKFHTRCSECMKVCKFKVPEYIEVEKDHFVACHLYNKGIMANLAAYDEEYDKLEEQKRIAEELAASQEKNIIKKIIGKIKPVKTADTKAPTADNEIAATEEKAEVNPIEEAVEKQPTEEIADQFTETSPQAETVETPTEEVAEKAEEAERQTEEPETPEAKPATEKPTANKSTTTKKSTTAGKSTSTKKSTTANKSTSTKKSMTANKSTATKKSTTANKSATTKKSTTANKSTATKKSTTAGKSTTAKKATASKPATEANNVGDDK